MPILPVTGEEYKKITWKVRRITLNPIICSGTVIRQRIDWSIRVQIFMMIMIIAICVSRNGSVSKVTSGGAQLDSRQEQRFLLSDVIFSYLRYSSEDRYIIFLRNVFIYLLVYTASHTKRTSSSPLWKPQFSRNCILKKYYRKNWNNSVTITEVR
jgi:hypothetical protein